MKNDSNKYFNIINIIIKFKFDFIYDFKGIELVGIF